MVSSCLLLSFGLEKGKKKQQTGASTRLSVIIFHIFNTEKTNSKHFMQNTRLLSLVVGDTVQPPV